MSRQRHLNDDGDILDAGESPKVWKLGDIVNSTPSIHAGLPLGNYFAAYDDRTYKEFYESAAYRSHGEVFVGSNSGLFHAFKLGTLQTKWGTRDQEFEFARMINPTTGLVCDPSDAEPCGSEIWAYIPRNVLPYVKYDMDTGYCHTYTVDGMPLLVDVSINGAATGDKTAASWRTLVIGSMRYGGACKASDSACDAATECVKAPGVDINDDKDINTDAEKKLGLSSYFAIDITDPNPANWDLLWEFTHEELGFSTTGPTIVKISPKKGDKNGDGLFDSRDDGDDEKNGHWYVALLSGPTGPNDIASRQFMGRSDQNLKLFVLDLRNTGAWLKDTNYWVRDTGIANAFGGSTISATVDPDVDYQDDALYLTYTESAGLFANPFIDGGVLRVLTNEISDPTQWRVNKFMEDIGTVTASAGRLKNIITKDLWVYFGTGRYFFKQGILTDDPVTVRRLHGVKDPCYRDDEFLNFNDLDFPAECGTPIALASLQDVTALPNAVEDDEGWFLTLDAQNFPDNGFDAERVITNPAVSGPLEAVFFTTFKPSADVCSFGGISLIWALQYDTGGEPSNLIGKALLQVSTGSIEQIDLKDAFKANDPGDPDYDPDRPDNPDPTGTRGDRRTPGFIGKPPEGPGLILLAAPPPYGNIVHTTER
jgi:type IV pilus assembly protein PilY1